MQKSCGTVSRYTWRHSKGAGEEEWSCVSDRHNSVAVSLCLYCYGFCMSLEHTFQSWSHLFFFFSFFIFFYFNFSTSSAYIKILSIAEFSGCRNQGSSGVFKKGWGCCWSQTLSYKVAVITVGRKERKYLLFGGLIISSFLLLLFWLYFTHCYLTASELSLFSHLLF